MNTSLPKVSVIIPTYNRARYICRAINSVLNQTFTDHEIIIVDDGSTDNTKEILAQYENKIIYLPQSNKGISASRNRGIDAARGKYIAFLDSDDEWLPEKLAIQVDMLDKSEKLGLVCSRMLILDDDGKHCGYKPEEQTGKNFKELIKIGGDLPTSTVMTRKECFEKVGVFDAALPPMEDFEMWVRIASKYDIYMLPEKVLAYYYHHAGQITKDMTLVYEATVKLDKKFIGLFKHLAGFPIKIVHKRMAANEYVLSRIYYKKRMFPDAFRTLCDAILRCPTIGMLFVQSKDTPKEKIIKFFKPYGYFIVCLGQLICDEPCKLLTRKRTKTKAKSMTDFKNMKIAFIHEYSHHFVGQERSLLERLIGLKELGIQCEVLLPESGQFCDLLKKEGFQVRFYSLNHLSKINPFPYFKTVWEIFRLIKANKYSIIHCSGAYPNQYGLPAARLSGISCITHINTTIYTKEFLNKCFINFTDYIITVSEGARQKIFQETRAPQNKVKTIYDSIGNDHILEYLNSGQQLRKNFHIDAKTKVIGQIGTLIPLKGYEYFIEMAKIVKEAYPDVKFFIVGPTHEEDYKLLLKKKIAQLNLQGDVILPGFQEDPYPFIDMFDISVLASTVEGLGRVIIESQKMGKPVIGTDIIGMNEAIIDHKTGLIVPPRDPRALADAVLELLLNPQKAKELALQGQKSAFERFGQKKHAQLVSEVYRNLWKGER